MLVKQVAALYRRYTGQIDMTVVSAAQQQLDLEMGHEEYRDELFKYAPTLEADVVTITMPGGTSNYDLSAGVVIVYGLDAVLTHARLLSAVAICPWDAVNLVPVPPMYQLLHHDVAQQLDEVSNPWGAYMQRDFLSFTGQPAGDFILYYRGQGPMPVGAAFGVDWSKTTPADNEPIDKLWWYHDLIAMYAAQQYDIVRWESNPVLVAKFNDRLKKFRSYLRRFNGDGDTMIQSGQANTGFGWNY